MASTSGQKTPSIPPQPSTSKSSSSKKKKSKDGGVSSDEERWLDALESGKLEEMDDELKKIKPKDPKLMTARQRAMYERGSDKDPNPATETLMSLPTGYKEKILTAEAIQKAALKSQKRKQQADEKREKDKKKTMERILKKQESKTQKNSNFRPNRNVTSLVSYKQTIDLATLSFHPEIQSPIVGQKAPRPPKPVFCAMDCGNLKKYSCSKTGVPLCSLECYRKNVSSRIL